MLNISNYVGGGASLDKKTLKSWTPRHSSAKVEVDGNLNLLRARCSDLVKNSPLGAAIVSTMTAGVVGSGLRIFPRVKGEAVGLSAENARLWNKNAKREFELWASNPLHCDFLRRNNFFELQQIFFSASLVDGDSFCLFKRRLPSAYNPYSLRLQAIDALRVSNPITIGAGTFTEMIRGNRRIVNGIEFDRNGVMDAIWIANRVWDEFDSLNPQLSWQRVRLFGRDTGLRNVLHITKDIRPDQARGIPLLAPIVESLKQISRYCDAELSAAIIRSFFSIFFTQKERDRPLNDIVPRAENARKDDSPVDVSEFKLSSPSVTSLPCGVDVKAVDSAKNQSSFAEFVSTFIQQSCAAVGLPAETVLKTFNASYSASRAAILQSEAEFRQRRNAFINDLLNPVYENFLAEAIAIGRIDAPGFFDDPIKKSAWLNADWQVERTGALDEVKAANAAVIRLQNGLSTYERELAESGQDFDDVVERLRQERKIMGGLQDEQVDS